MEQQQIRVSLSVGTKLLFSLVSLLLLVIVFLNITTILLFREDKQAYVYQAQSSQALLSGKDFVTTSQLVLDTLRIALANVDPRKPIQAHQLATLQSIIDNQTRILMSSIQLVDLGTGQSTTYSKTIKEKEVQEYGLSLDSLQIPSDWMNALIPELLKSSFAFYNPSQLGGHPLLAILLADTNLKDSPEGMPVSIGIISLKDFGKDLGSTKLTIATQTGWIIFDTDPAVFFAKDNASDNPLFQTAIANKVTNGAKEYELNGIRYLGSYFIPGLNLVVLSNTEWRLAMKATYMLIEKFFLLGSMSVGAAIIFAILFSKTLTAPLARLYNATKEVAKGNFLLSLEESGRDEISALSSSFNSMSKRISELVQESMEKVKLENEVAIASTVQQTLIPPSDFRSPWLHIHSHYQAASQCGGDWWGFFGVGSKVAIMIADATGHGLPSALITASARSCFSVMHKLAQEDPEFSFSPAAMLSFANRVIFDTALGQIMMTFFICVLDLDAKTITYSSAGHNPPWLFKYENGSYTLKSLTAVGQRLGEVRDAPIFEEKTLEIGPKDIVFLYTDGLTEGKNNTGEMYGKKRVKKLVESHLNGGPNQIITQLIKDFLQHNDGKPLDDDVTLAAAMILNFPPSEGQNV